MTDPETDPHFGEESTDQEPTYGEETPPTDSGEQTSDEDATTEPTG